MFEIYLNMTTLNSIRPAHSKRSSLRITNLDYKVYVLRNEVIQEIKLQMMPGSTVQQLIDKTLNRLRAVNMDG